MAWLAVDVDGAELIFDEYPMFNKELNDWVCIGRREACVIELPKGTIEKIIGRELNKLDEVVEI